MELDLFRKCDLSMCSKVDDNNVETLHGCGNSYHTRCFPDGQDVCTVCKDEIKKAIASLSELAKSAILNPGQSSKQDIASDSDDKEDQDDSCLPEISTFDAHTDSCLQ